MFEEILKAVACGIILALTIGPVFFVLIETSVTKGFRAALSFDLGVIFADILFILVAFFSTTKILEKVKDDPNLLIFGGALLFIYGLISFVKTSKSFRKIIREHRSVTIKKNYFELFFKGFLLNFINFGVLGVWIATIVLAESVTSSPNGVVIFLSTVLLTYLATDLLKIFLAKKLKSKLTPRRVFNMKKIVSLIILFIGLGLVVQGFFPSGMAKVQKKIEKTTQYN
ncbi:LysE family translocator [Pseudofulvibacter geojedonensis]|uniref:LysE family translocator n=1 Tax=Pseudofulvibacter geojedonensis TaxID=1123758 RepID=A0ABW3I499_9FLAO